MRKGDGRNALLPEDRQWQTAVEASREATGAPQTLEMLLMEMEASLEHVKAITKTIRNDKTMREAVKDNPETILAPYETTPPNYGFTEDVLNWYKGLQRIVAVEELAELGVEIVKDVRGHGDLMHIAEELADVQIIYRQMYEWYESISPLKKDNTYITYDIERFELEKMRRTREIMKQEWEALRNGEGTEKQSSQS